MRWEIITTKIQENPTHSPKWVETLLIRAYRFLLMLYPVSFRADFADEMLAVFAMTVREASDKWKLANIMWCEVAGLPLSLIAAHRQAHNQLSAAIRQRQQTQWFVRIIGGLLSLFLLSTLRVILSPSYNLYAQAVPFVGMLFTACISLLVALRWGRVGGLLTIASGAGLGCCMTLYLYMMALSEIGLIATVIIGLIWALPFLIFGILFYELSKQSKWLITATK